MNQWLYFLVYLPIVTLISVFGIMFLINYKWHQQLLGGILLGAFFGFLLYFFGMDGGFLIQVPVLAIAFYRWYRLNNTGSKSEHTLTEDRKELKKNANGFLISGISYLVAYVLIYTFLYNSK